MFEIIIYYIFVYWYIVWKIIKFLNENKVKKIC